ncbi:asparaginase [Brytella acorum]|uniref:Asparaginase n=1 Tax=Brytella acorum TaxID=2959299 RepID=A0AA35XWN4_9PROT|nr:asparaginase [Brytella acorum]MDF3625070.1 asparaginase [Brytella acorum]CAI9121051.1 asparaginase [Brytella acorum]
MTSGLLAEVFRGGRVESSHLGRAVVVDSEGDILWSLGDVEAPIFPRSTVKALLALPFVESGAAERLGASQEELALACASHNGEQRHADAAARLLSRVGRDVTCLECGVHWPTYEAAARALATEGHHPTALHNNCSGKHAAMICTACDLGLDPTGYVLPKHPVQREATEILATLTGTAHNEQNRGTDGCSMPTYAIPLRALATGFARFGSSTHMSGGRAVAATKLREAIAAAPFMVAGTGRFDTRIMEHFQTRVFCKMGAEGVMVAALPELGLGFALKADDGGNRAVEVAVTVLLQRFGASLWSPHDEAFMTEQANYPLRNWNGFPIGSMQPAACLIQ